MKKDQIFFGENGITTTSANHLANIAKEMYQALEETNKNIGFIRSTVKLLSGGEESVLECGVDTTIHLTPNLEKIAKLKSLIAWLREAMKAKQRLINEASNLEYRDPNMPLREAYLTEDDVISTWNIKKRSQYYHIETMCAVFGEFIHPSGQYAKQRANMLKKMNSPKAIEGHGRDAIIYSYSPSLDPEEVESTYFQLQNEFRGYQAQLNSLKHEIEMAIAEDTRAKDLTYSQTLHEYIENNNKAFANFQKEKNLAIQKAQNLKIIIPDYLKSIYDEVKGKKD